MDAYDPTVGIDIIPVAPSAKVVMLREKVMLALPWMKQISPITSFCVGQLADRRRTQVALNWDDSYVIHSRDSLADAFLATPNAEWMLTLDDDCLIPFGSAKWFRAHTRWTDYPEPFASFNALDRLLSHGKTLVGALYWGRHPDANPVYGEGAKEKEYCKGAPYDICKPCSWVGTGCLLIHKSVYLDIEKKFPRLARKVDGKGGHWFTPSEDHALDAIDRARKVLSEGGPMDGAKAMKAYEILEGAATLTRTRTRLGMGEDVTFGRRAAESGHMPHVDLGLLVGHLGAACYPIRNL